MQTTKFPRIGAAVTVFMVAAFGISGCSTPSNPETGATAETMVIPQQTGVVPYSFLDKDSKLVGLLPSLSSALSGPLGVKVENEATTFENSLLGLQRGIYKTVPGADVTAERLKTFDFATVLRDSYSFRIPAGKTAIADDMMAMCGESVAVTAGSSPIVELLAQSDKCEAAGKKKLTVLTFADQATADLTVQSGQATVSTGATSVVEHDQASNPGKWTVTGPKYQFIDIGFATKKGDGNAQKIQTAVNALIADGTYKKILGEYGTPGMAVDSSVINPAPKS